MARKLKHKDVHINRAPQPLAAKVNDLDALAEMNPIRKCYVCIKAFCKRFKQRTFYAVGLELRFVVHTSYRFHRHSDHPIRHCAQQLFPL